MAKDALDFIPTPRDDHGLVLRPKDLDYTDLTRFGRLSIRNDNNGTHIDVAGFDFTNASSCRQVVTKAMCWARDLLDAAIRADVLVPGGTYRISVADDSGPEDEEPEAE